MILAYRRSVHRPKVHTLPFTLEFVSLDTCAVFSSKCMRAHLTVGPEGGNICWIPFCDIRILKPVNFNSNE